MSCDCSAQNRAAVKQAYAAVNAAAELVAAHAQRAASPPEHEAQHRSHTAVADHTFGPLVGYLYPETVQWLTSQKPSHSWDAAFVASAWSANSATQLHQGEAVAASKRVYDDNVQQEASSQQSRQLNVEPALQGKQQPLQETEHGHAAVLQDTAPGPSAEAIKQQWQEQKEINRQQEVLQAQLQQEQAKLQQQQQQEMQAHMQQQEPTSVGMSVDTAAFADVAFINPAATQEAVSPVVVSEAAASAAAADMRSTASSFESAMEQQQQQGQERIESWMSGHESVTTQAEANGLMGAGAAAAGVATQQTAQQQPKKHMRERRSGVT